MHLKLGTTLQGGKYRIEQVLGQGGFGITYLAVDGNGNYVAIKEFFLKRENKREATGEVSDCNDGEITGYYRNRFKKEAAHLATLHHPGIVKYIESFDENNTSYFAMEYVDGESLDKYATDRVIPIEDSVAIIREVAGILKYLHDQNQLHLDLKPGNIMRRFKDGKMVLVDFGLSKNYTDDGHAETSINMNAQTEGYAPMEMSNSARTGNLLPRIDVYSLGATLYKLLTRVTPPSAVNVLNYHEDFIQAMKKCAIPQPLISLIERAMEPRANARIQDMNQFVRELDAATRQMGEQNTATSEQTNVYEGQTTRVQPPKIQMPNPQPQPAPVYEEPEKPTKKKKKFWKIAGIILVISLIAYMTQECGNSTSNVANSEQVEEEFIPEPNSMEGGVKDAVTAYYDCLKNKDFIQAAYKMRHNNGAIFTQIELNDCLNRMKATPTIVSFVIKDIKVEGGQNFIASVETKVKDGYMSEYNDQFQMIYIGNSWYIIAETMNRVNDKLIQN